MKGTITAILIALLSASVLTQNNNITNTLGAGGMFTIKDASTIYFSLTQSSGNLSIQRTIDLPNTISSNTGVITKGGIRFLHNYGISNTFLGINAGNFTMTGALNTSVGYESFIANVSGSYNTTIGYRSLYSNTSGNYNTALGDRSMYYNTLGESNTAIGYQTLFFNTTGYVNTAIGQRSLFYNTTGHRNTAIGFNSLLCNTEGSHNTAVGYWALYNSGLGNYNTALGSGSLYSNVNGNYNTSVGFSSLYNNTNGINNTAIGASSGLLITSGYNVTCIGYNSQPAGIGSINQITLGDNNVTSLRCNVQTITSLSDARDKKNIKDLMLGLDFIAKLKPRLFNWDKREWYDNNVSDESKMQVKLSAGFIAQELDELQMSENAEWLNLVLKDNPDKLEATPGNLLPVIVKAIQELSEENEKLRIKNVELEEQLTGIIEKQNELVKILEQLKDNKTKEINSSER